MIPPRFGLAFEIIEAVLALVGLITLCAGGLVVLFEGVAEERDRNR